MIALYDDHSTHKLRKQKKVTTAKSGKRRSNYQSVADSGSEPLRSGAALASSTADVTDADFPQADLLKKGQQQTLLGRLKSVSARLYANHQLRRADRLALQQLMQLDDYLLRDMGLTRMELGAIQLGSSTLDAQLKKVIVENRDRSCSSTSIKQ